MIVTGVNGSIQWKQGLLHGAALMAAVCGADLVCEKKLAFRKMCIRDSHMVMFFQPECIKYPEKKEACARPT